MQGAEPAAGVLYLVGTPIGNLGDLSPRARQVLAGVDRIACEDTRHSGLLLHNLSIKGRLVSFHEHNQAARIPELLLWEHALLQQHLISLMMKIKTTIQYLIIMLHNLLTVFLYHYRQLFSRLLTHQIILLLPT
ncbi:MAG: rRNA ((1402)-2-O)-methyltransferase [Cyanobacteriota bacterium]